ncbi:MAG: hypothetical protein LBC96_06350 [Lachnospiraceae bacterium]|jgi:hypothetical protein|nr:hypothetical protein [Lachnospiraceae bacterium]
MILILPTQIRKFRTLGWVQNPSDFRSLCNVVAIFDKNSSVHNELIEKIIPEKVLIKDGQLALLLALKSDPLKVKYSHLVGSSFTPRSKARCNAIVQACVKGQGKKGFIDDWSADGFIRWAHCFGFIKYDQFSDTFEITKNGLALSEAYVGNKEINNDEKNY